MEAPNYNVEQFLNDCEGELSLFRNLEVMNKIAEDIRNFDFKTIEDKLTDQELEKYIKLIPGGNHSTRRRLIINWLKENPAMMTVDPKLLYQRFFLYKRQIGVISRLQNPAQKKPIQQARVKFNAIGRFVKHMYNQEKRNQELLKQAEQVQQQQQQVQQTPRKLMTFVKQADGTLKLIE